MPRTALIVVDMINSYEFKDADKLVRSVEESLPAIQRMIRRATDDDALTICRL